MRKVHELLGVDGVAPGVLTPWREGGQFGPGLQFTGEGYARGTAEEDPRGQFHINSPGFFAALGVPLIAGRDFNDLDRKGSESVAIISQSVFPVARCWDCCHFSAPHIEGRNGPCRIY